MRYTQKNTRGGESEGEMYINNSIVSFFYSFLISFRFLFVSLYSKRQI